MVTCPPQKLSQQPPTAKVFSFIDTEEMAYDAMWAREAHHFWHILFGLPTNLIGESALKVTDFEQMLLPMRLLSVVAGTRFNEK
uniref:Uncharacterized protein n=1 Tax=Nelumbo nucifera TaxID=4432 RepID=A0A822YFF2_NELNU|nr:TPA_asm: hypothetical protein HUJ06_010003 [Nelumbo nucifera]